MQRDALVAALDRLLDPDRMEDHGPNGLQVEGRDTVHKVVTAVTASRAVLEAALEQDADAVLVHHGILWDRGAQPITGWHRERVRLLLAEDISLLAYHLPLDLHPTLGNNATIVKALGLRQAGRFGEHDLGFIGTAPKALTPGGLQKAVRKALGDEPRILPGDREGIKRIGVVSGAGQRWFEAAIAAGCDAFISGEASEYVTHLARETGVHYVWAGHHATERGGIQALGAHLAKAHRLKVAFVDEENPV